MEQKLIALALLLTGIVLGCAWWLGGWRVLAKPASPYQLGRSVFGRVTMVENDRNGDGLRDEQIFFPWDHPYEGSCSSAFIYKEGRQDRDFDGNWDVWIYPNWADPSATIVEVDLIGDGKPDHVFVYYFREGQSLEMRIKEEERAYASSLKRHGNKN